MRFCALAAGAAAKQLMRRAQLQCAAVGAAARTAHAGPLAGPRPLSVEVVCHVALARPLTTQQRADLARSYAARRVSVAAHDAEHVRYSAAFHFWTVAAGPPPDADDERRLHVAR